jgi:hypothetical protein
LLRGQGEQRVSETLNPLKKNLKAFLAELKPAEEAINLAPYSFCAVTTLYMRNASYIVHGTSCVCLSRRIHFVLCFKIRAAISPSLGISNELTHNKIVYGKSPACMELTQLSLLYVPSGCGDLWLTYFLGHGLLIISLTFPNLTLSGGKGECVLSELSRTGFKECGLPCVWLMDNCVCEG